MSYVTVWATYGSPVSWCGTYADLKGLGDKLEALRDLQTDEVIAATLGLPFSVFVFDFSGIPYNSLLN